MQQSKFNFEGLMRVDHYDYPQYAVREALLNAVVHRDYDYSGSILINIFSNRIEFVSIGGLVKGITLHDVSRSFTTKKHSYCKYFYRLKLIESYGTGIQRIMESYQDQMVAYIQYRACIFCCYTLRGKPFNDSTTDEETVMNLLNDKNLLLAKMSNC